MASTSFIAYVTPRALAGAYQGPGISTAASNSRNLKSFLPDITVPPVDAQGNWNPRWWFFFDYFVNFAVDLKSNITLKDLTLQVQIDQALAIAAANRSALAQQQANTNAQVIAATREVVQNAALPGAQQIPIPKLALEDLTAGV